MLRKALRFACVSAAVLFATAALADYQIRFSISVAAGPTGGARGEPLR